ncbi:hypothetical protein [Chondrinema litorale]|uniref:hypothetical protein n=1 Tax=Chondrinema litorale TaxID=2994555 RepID=UPI002543F248|nr:hypothetical protein [Chondrinema litorale]UZR97045.1 hypothetical protein OQ292_23385 [Chondrinema litorale]
MKAESQLRITLKFNAVFSAISGFILAVFAEFIGDLIGLDQNIILMYIGFTLILFATFVFLVALSKTLNKGLVKFIILQDVLWILASIVLLIVSPFSITFTGKILIIGISLVVADFAYFQFRFLRLINSLERNSV